MIKMLPISLLNSTQGGPMTQSLPFISNSHVRPCVTQWAFLRKTILLGSMSFLSGTVLVMRPKASANKHVDGNSCWRKAWQWRSFSTLVTTCTYCKFVGSHCTGKQKNSAVMIWLNHEHHPKYPKDISVDYCMGKHCHIRARCSKWEVQAGFDPPKLLGSCWNEFPWLLRAIDPCKHGKASPWLNKPFLAVVLPKDATTTKENYLGPSPEQAMVKGQLRGQRVKDGQRLGVYNIVQLRIPSSEARVGSG